MAEVKTSEAEEAAWDGVERRARERRWSLDRRDFSPGAEAYARGKIPLHHRVVRALRHLDEAPKHMVYRGDKSQTWYVSGPDAPRITFSKSEIEHIISSGWMSAMYPDDQRVGIDALAITDAGRKHIGRSA